MYQDNNIIHNINSLQYWLVNRFKNICLEDEPYFMINYKPQPYAQCFLTTDDINKCDYKRIFDIPKNILQKLCALTLPIQRDQIQIEKILDTFVKKLKEKIIQLVSTIADNMSCKSALDPGPYDFLVKFYKGNYKENEKLLISLEELIRKWSFIKKNVTLNSIENELQEAENKCNQAREEVEKILKNLINLVDWDESNKKFDAIKKITKKLQKA